jgi:hypothetical protein
MNLIHHSPIWIYSFLQNVLSTDLSHTAHHTHIITKCMHNWKTWIFLHSIHSWVCIDKTTIHHLRWTSMDPQLWHTHSRNQLQCCIIWFYKHIHNFQFIWVSFNLIRYITLCLWNVQNKMFTKPSKTTSFYLETARCFGCVHPSLSHQHNILKHGKNGIHMYSPHGFTLWDPTSLWQWIDMYCTFTLF